MQETKISLIAPQKTSISLIASLDSQRGIGRNNQLIFKIPGDLPRFKKITMGHPIIMGRKTFESIGKVLPGRTNIIITRDKNFKAQGVVVYSLEEAIKKAKSSPGHGEVFIIGGGEIFKQSIKLADQLYLTLVEGDFKADTFFPDYGEFKKIVFKEDHQSPDYRYSYVNLIR